MPTDPAVKTMDAPVTATLSVTTEPDNSHAHALAANVVATAQQTAALPADHPAHFNFTALLKFLLAIAPAIASPFIKNAGSREIFNQESQVAGAVAENLPG